VSENRKSMRQKIWTYPLVGAICCVTPKNEHNGGISAHQWVFARRAARRATSADPGKKTRSRWTFRKPACRRHLHPPHPFPVPGRRSLRWGQDRDIRHNPHWWVFFCETCSFLGLKLKFPPTYGYLSVAAP